MEIAYLPKEMAKTAPKGDICQFSFLGPYSIVAISLFILGDTT